MNPVKAFLVDDPKDYPWTCYRQFIGLPGSPMEADINSLIPAVDSDPKTAWKLFHRAMECETNRPIRTSPFGLTMTDMHARQFEWLLEIAQDRRHQVAEEQPETVAIFWARQEGISTKAIAKILGIPNRSVSDTLYQFRSRIRANPALEDVLTLS
jgi:hypothetical protein